jgi:hypothetical protein
MSKISQPIRRIYGQHYTVITSGSETTWLRQDTMKSYGMSTINKVPMNLPRMFNMSIYKTIDAFMKTRPIFQPPHSRDFMDSVDDVCSPTFQETKFIIASDEGTSMCEIELDQEPVYTMFNVDCNMISNPATLTTNPNKPTTLTILINNFATSTMLLNENSSVH